MTLTPQAIAQLREQAEQVRYRNAGPAFPTKLVSVPAETVLALLDELEKRAPVSTQTIAQALSDAFAKAESVDATNSDFTAALTIAREEVDAALQPLLDAHAQGWTRRSRQRRRKHGF